jgi:beta-glucanase (GH16 family)
VDVQSNSSSVSHRPWSNRPARLLILLSILAAVVVQAGLQAPPPAQAQTSWNLVWSDEFNGTSVNTSNWTFETGGGGWGNNELEYYTNGQNASVSGGILTIEARRESGGYNCWYGPCQWTSTRMNTKGKRQFQYGRIEARLAVPSGQGLWPAFWALGANFPGTPWPNCGEIDIMENIGSEPNTVHGTVHGPNYSGGAGIGGPYSLSSGRFTDDYHLFAVEWESNVMRWYVDGNLYFTLTKATVEARGRWVFDHPNFIILNLAVGGAWPGNPNGSTVFPQRMYIDYVRVYQ